MPPIRFAADIHLVPRKWFLPRPERVAMNQAPERQASTAPWTAKEVVSLQPRGYTESARTCNVVGLTTEDPEDRRVSLLHLNPLKMSIAEALDALQLEIDKMGALGKGMRALLTAGKPSFRESRRQGEALYEELMDSEIPTSVIWGQARDYGETDVYYNGWTNQWQLHCTTDCQATTGDVVRLNRLRKAFANIDLDPGDRLFLGRTEIPHSLLARWRKKTGLRHPTPAQIAQRREMDDAQEN
jgi:hypothetical protein